MNKRLASALLCAALLGSGILRADNIVISNRKSSILITAPKGESPRIQYFGPRLANPGDVFDSGSAFNDPVYPQFGVQCSRETAIQATHNDGNMSLELVVESVTRENRDGGQVTAIATRDKFYPFYVTIYYKTYPDCEVIETWTEIRHLEKNPVTLYRFASAFLPVRRGDNWLSHFHGPWGAEAYLYEEALTDGMRVIKDKDGVRNTQNSCPSFMLTLDGRPDEQHGMVIGGTLAWSGNYRIAIDNDNAHTTRIFAGINEDQSQYILEPKEVFTTPVFAFTFSDEGKGGVSRNFHRWARLHRLNHGGEQRSILLNSWEGVSMNVNQEVMDQMMADFAAMGGEMFVMDDGWFGDKYPRNNGTSSLGDWVVCKEKLPEGIKGLTASAREKGLKFGIWIEPEMTNSKSELFEKHPEWVIQQPHREMHKGRGGTQLVLDLSNPEVQEFVFGVVDKLMTAHPEIAYIKWDANRNANINVKLVSEAGVGTIAAGVAKGGAQVILVSGYDGGTGAAPRTSIKNAGLPWELGIAETHQTLILNGLRTRVRIESDSKLLSGRDVAISCMLGAEEFGFGTTLLMAEGCVMMRVCNLDTCPMGICTQNPELRKNFKGKPEYIINYLTFVAEELREYMAKLGVRTVDELVGRTDLLRVKPAAPGSRAAKLDLDCILHNPAIANSNVHFIKEDSYDFHLENTLDMKVLMKKFKLGSKAPQSVSLNVSNVDRAFGAIFGSEITRKYGNDLPDDVYTVHCNGAGGQSFGAFIPNGLTLELVGDCNDYMGKGLSGGKIVVRPPQGIDFKPEENIITGNVALYGATSGKAFISGVAGERFCVRNSGATAVVEGVGDHGCEYMTGGTVVVLGQTGKNFAAGMTGGIAYVLDENWDFYQRVNKETVSLEPVEHKYDVATLKELIRAHVEATGSPRGKEILDNFSAFLPKFKKVLPYDYDRMLRVIASVEERGLDGEQAQIEAFYAVQKHK